MLKSEKVREVKELLATGRYSQRTISKLTGVSRVVVHRIATGKRKDRIERPKEAWEDDWSGRPYRRCAICGSKVRLPCLACIIRNLARKRAVSVYRNRPGIVLGLELEEKHYIRYKQVRTWRESQRNPDFIEIPENWPFRKHWKNNRDTPGQ